MSVPKTVDSSNAWGDGSMDSDMEGIFEITIKARDRGQGNTRGSASGRGYGSGYNNWDNRFRGYGDQRYLTLYIKYKGLTLIM